LKLVALTGNIGSGKTFICSVFEHIGIPVFYSDIAAKNLYFDKSILREIEKVFGKNLIKDNVLDKEALSLIVFNDKEKLKTLEEITHPKVWESFLYWKEKQSSPYVIMESAILFEKHWNTRFDYVISVRVEEKIAIARAMKRDNSSLKLIENRMSQQMNIEEKCKLSNFVIENNENDMLLSQILEINNRIINS
jgi:dephospho-CoA kinase